MDFADINGRTALSKAIDYRRPWAVKLLLELSSNSVSFELMTQLRTKNREIYDYWSALSVSFYFSCFCSIF